MNEQQQIGTVETYASYFESFLKDHPFVVAIVAPILLSWVLTSALKGWVRPFILPARQNLTIRTIDCVIATAAAGLMWPGDHVLVFAPLIGCASPFAYGGFTAAICWKWPGARRWLTLRELEPDLPAPAPPSVSPPPDTQ